MIRLTYPAGITKDLGNNIVKGVKLNGIRPIKIEILTPVEDHLYEHLIDDCVVNINHYAGEVFYLGSKVWGKR
jgi:hypothetical protein